MERMKGPARATCLAAAVLFLVLGCALSPNDPSREAARTGAYIQLSVDAGSSRSVSVTEYPVTGMDIVVYDPKGQVLQKIGWLASDGSRTYLVPVGRDGEHRLSVTHKSVQDLQEVDATEYATFNILPMVITLIHIVPGRIGLISVDPAQPDLVVMAAAVTCWSTDSVSWSYTIKNIGSAPANLDGPTGDNADNVSIQAYLSADTVFQNDSDIAAGGTIIGSSPLGTLDPGETFSGTFSASAPVNPAVTPYLVLKVDYGGVVAESDESNNTLAVPLGEEGCHPDLIVSSLAVTAFTSSSISYNYTITNIGGAPAHIEGPTSSDFDNVSVQAYTSPDTIFANAGDFPAGGTIVGSSPLADLNPGDSLSGSFTSGATVDRFKLPYLVLKVDFGDSVTESNEANNTLAATY